jgi:hypothetical protein
MTAFLAVMSTSTVSSLKNIEVRDEAVPREPLKNELGRQLSNARTAGGCYNPEGRTAVEVTTYCSEAIELRVVEYVKELRPQFH